LFFFQDVMSVNVRLLSLHENKHLLNSVVDLLNDEWPQSKTIRLRRLERSSDDLPISFVLINDENQLIGYCYVDRLVDEPTSVILESVCIQRNLRGHGHGKILMKLLETKLQGFDWIYLTTIDKRQFYEKCGYEQTIPRVRLNVSSKLFNGNNELFKNLLSNQPTTTDSHAILQKGSTIERVPTVWMRKSIKSYV